MALYYVFSNVLTSERMLKIALAGFIGGGTSLALVGVLGISRHTEPKYIDFIFRMLKKIPAVDFRLPGAERGFHPNALAGTLVLVLPLGLVLFWPYLKKRLAASRLYASPVFPVFALSSFLIMGFVILLTQSRGSFAGLFLSSWLLLAAGRRIPKKVLVGFAVFIVAAFILYFSLIGTHHLPYADLEARNKLVARVNLFWGPAVRTMAENPWFGIGLNRVREFPQVGDYQAHFHNQLLQTGAELGIPALVAYLALIGGAGFLCRRVWKRSSRGWMRLSALGLGCGQCAFFFFGLMDAVPLGSKVGIFFWISLALIAGLHNRLTADPGVVSPAP